MFKQLIGVNGIGPKAALGILSTLEPYDLRLAIMTGDAKEIAKAPGVGAKTAQRIILDLKDKVQIEHMLPGETEENTEESQGMGAGLVGKEAIEALVSLGYSNIESQKAVRLVTITEEMTVEDVLKASLKHLAF